MTEDDAKEKWCPFARVFDTGSSNRVAADDDGPTAAAAGSECIASDCMAWRWAISPKTIEQAAKSIITSPEGPKEPTGFCGLAGKP